MKKIMFALALLAGVCFAQAGDVVVDAYDFKASVSVPVLANGVRTYKAQGMKGMLYLTWETNALVSATVKMENTKSHVKHVVDMTDYMVNMMGKSTKYTARSTPTTFFHGADSETADASYGYDPEDGHEFIVNMSMSGTGSIKSTKTTVTGCTSCGGTTKYTEYCTKATTLTGYLVGVMDCQCPEDVAWSHTLKTGACGIDEDAELEDIRDHNASFKGTYTAKWNKKVSAQMTSEANL